MMKAINDDDGRRHLFPRLFRAHHGGAIALCAGNTFRDKGPAGHDERIQRPASRFRLLRTARCKSPIYLASRGRLVSIAANTRTTISTRKDDLRDIIRLLACTGARLAEISGLEVQDIDLQEMTINICFNVTRRLKNNQSVRTVPVVDERAIEALRVRVADKRLTDAVFPRYGRDGGPDSVGRA